MTFLILCSIVLAIVLGYVTRLNIGLFAMVFAYALGAFGLGMKPSEVIALWPVKIFFVIFAVTLFYNVALSNGALEKLSGHLLYRCRRFPQLLPLAVFFAAAVIAGLGAGFYTVLAFMAPLTLLLCQKTKMDMVIGAMAVNYGALAGANFMTSQSGIIFRGVLENTGIAQETAFTYSTGIFFTTLVIPLVVLGFFVLKNRRTSEIVIDAQLPEVFDRWQKLSLALIVVLMSAVLAFPILRIVLPDNALIATINKKLDIGLLAIVFTVASLMLKLADEKTIVQLVPWQTLIMICGMGMLIGVAVKAGVIGVLAGWVSENVSVWLIPVVVCVISAVMSVFSSTLGVVVPTLFPIIPAIAAKADLPPLLLFIAIVAGAQATAISPFSSGGSLILGSSPAGIDKQKLLNALLFKAIPIGLCAAVLAVIAAQLILGG